MNVFEWSGECSGHNCPHSELGALQVNLSRDILVGRWIVDVDLTLHTWGMSDRALGKKKGTSLLHSVRFLRLPYAFS
jgi:hypothetical protein